MFFFVTIYIVLLSGDVATGSNVYYKHSRLLNDLFSDYDKVAIPTPAPGVPVNVSLGLAVAQIITVDEKREGVNLNVWHRMKWNDYRLRWKPSDYDNIEAFLLDSNYFWIPDITLHEPLSGSNTKTIGETQDEDDLSWKIKVFYDGTVLLNFPGMIFGQCLMNIANYPFDEHNCSFVFSSWIHDASDINLSLRESNAMDLGNYVSNNEWNVISFGTSSRLLTYNCCPNPYALIDFHIKFKRGSSSYVSNYIIPSILILVLSLMMFTLPPEVGKRMEIGINLLLCLSVYLTIINTKMPSRSDVFPILSKFYGCCIFILTCSLLCTCWVVAYYFHDMSGWKIYTMSNFVQVAVLHYLRRLLRFPSPNKVTPIKPKNRITVQPVADYPNKLEKNPGLRNDEVDRNISRNAVKYEDQGRKIGQEKDRKKIEGKNRESKDKNNDKTMHGKRRKEEDVGEEKERREKDKRDARKKSKKEVEDVRREGSVEETVGKEESKLKESKKDGEIRKKNRKVRKDSNEEMKQEDGGRSSSDTKMERDPEKKRTKRKERKQKNVELGDSPQNENENMENADDCTVLNDERKERKARRRKRQRKSEVGMANEGAEESKESVAVRNEPVLDTAIDEKGGDGGKDMDPKDAFENELAKKEIESSKEGAQLLSYIADYMVDQTQRKRNRFRWRQAAIILNRLFMICLVLSIVFSIIIVFLAR